MRWRWAILLVDQTVQRHCLQVTIQTRTKETSTLQKILVSNINTMVYNRWISENDLNTLALLLCKAYKFVCNSENNVRTTLHQLYCCWHAYVNDVLGMADIKKMHSVLFNYISQHLCSCAALSAQKSFLLSSLHKHVFADYIQDKNSCLNLMLWKSPIDQNRLEHVPFSEYAIKLKNNKASGGSKVKLADAGKKNNGALGNADCSQTNSIQVEKSTSASKPKTKAKPSRKKNAKTSKSKSKSKSKSPQKRKKQVRGQKQKKKLVNKVMLELGAMKITEALVNSRKQIWTI